MKHIKFNPALFAAAFTVAVGGVALATQDKYSVSVPNGLAFSEFRGYEDWQVISMSHGKVLAVILGNPAMIDAYKAGIPANGKPVPDGAKMAKIHWVPRVMEDAPGQPTVPGVLHDVDFMVKDSKRFADSGGWGYVNSNTTQYPTRSGQETRTTSLRSPMTPNADLHATPSFSRRTTFSPLTQRGDQNGLQPTRIL